MCIRDRKKRGDHDVRQRRMVHECIRILPLQGKVQRRDHRGEQCRSVNAYRPQQRFERDDEHERAV